MWFRSLPLRLRTSATAATLTGALPCLLAGGLLLTACDGDISEPKPPEIAVLNPEDAGGSASELVVRILDVGYGDAAVITNGGSTVLVDGGSSSPRYGIFLDSLGLRGATIDAVILTHGDPDHFGGLHALFESSRGIMVRRFFDNQDPTALPSLAQLRDSVLARQERGELVYHRAGDPCGAGTPVCTFHLRGGGRLQILRPVPFEASTDNRSTAVKIVGPDSASFSMWLAGDARRTAIEWFEDAGYHLSPGMRVNVFKANAHGHCSGITRRHLGLLDPEWTIFSVAPTPTRDVVHEQVKNLLRESGRRWYRTDLNGTITLRTSGQPGGGYTVQVGSGEHSLDGPGDGWSEAAACDPIP